MTEQRTKQWHEQRLGKFTSSSIHKLMGVKGIGLTGTTYCFELAVDIVEGKDWNDDFISFDMQRGIDLEPFAFELFKSLMSKNFIRVEKSEFVRLNENEGSSPDGLVGDFGVLEIKCPKRDKFFRIVAFGEPEIDPAYLWQMQHQMYTTSREKAFFLNYYIHNGQELYHLLEIDRDDEMIEKIQERTIKGIEVRDQFVDQISNNIQYRKPGKLPF